MNGNVFGPSVNTLGISSIYSSHLVFKGGGINLSYLETFIHMC